MKNISFLVIDFSHIVIHDYNGAVNSNILISSNVFIVGGNQNNSLENGYRRKPEIGKRD